MADLFDVRGGNLNLSASALSFSGADTLYSTTGTQTFVIGGRVYTTAADTNVEVPDTDATTGAAFVALATLKQCLFVFGWLASGEMGVSQGPIVDTADVVDGSAALVFPSIPDTLVPFAYASAKYVGSGTWTFGTSNWDATTVTFGTVVEVMLLPTRPLTAASA